MEVEQVRGSYKDGFRKLRARLNELKVNTDIADDEAERLHAVFPDILKKKIGDRVTDFSLPNALSESVKLSDYLKKGKVILVFYRGSWCPYCNVQLNHYQQHFDEMSEYGGQIMAISPEKPDQFLSLKEKYDLEFEILSDSKNQVIRQYTTVFDSPEAYIDELKKAGIDYDSYYEDNSRSLPIPAVYIIDENKKVIFAKSEGGDYRGRVEAEEIIKVLKKHAVQS